MSKAIRIHANGGPEVLDAIEDDRDPGRPGQGEALIRHTAIGLNFLDIYYRSGLYPPPAGFPLIPGSEAAGVVMEDGRGGRLAQGRRPRRLCRSARRLCRGARDRRRPAGQDAGRHQRRTGGRDDAEGHDRRISAAPHLQGEAGRHRALSRRRRRRRADLRPMGEASRRDRHRHRRFGRQDRARQGARLRPRHQLPRAGFRRRGRRRSPAAGMCDVVYDFGRQGYVSRLRSTA